MTRILPGIPIPVYGRSRSINFFNSSGGLCSITNAPGFRPSFTSKK
jgi:hypothetical protein